MGLVKRTSPTNMAPIKDVKVVKPITEKLPVDPAMDATDDTRFSRTSLIAEGIMDDSMLTSFVVDESSKVSGTVQKESAKTKVGISLQKSKATDSIIVCRIKEGGLFSATDLKVGQIVLTINGIPCPSTTVDAARLVAEATGSLTIEAADLKEDAAPALGPMGDESGPVDVIFTDSDIVEVAHSEDATEEASPAEVKSRDLPSNEEPQKSSRTMKIVSGIAVATGTVLVGALFAGKGSARSTTSLRRYPTKL